MAPPLLHGDTLGKKHKDYNKLVNESIASNQKIQAEELISGEYDECNLLKIDINCHNRNLNYIISVLKCEDMLYVSRALKQSIWLVADEEYAHIINPEYLNNHLFPQMTTKASNKMIKHIRHHLRNESRVEDFYKNETSKSKALKWLPNCSVAFIEKNIEKHLPDMEPHVFKRLCERSITIFEIAMKKHKSVKYLKAAIFFLNTDIDRYLDVVDESTYHQFKFNPKATRLIMEHCPDRITNKFKTYVRYIHISTFVKYLKREDIKCFLMEQAEELRALTSKYLLSFGFNDIKPFIMRLPKEEQFDFVKKVFLGKVIENSEEWDPEINEIKKLRTVIHSNTYNWYEFASFDVAFEEISKLIHAESNLHEKYSMLSVLITCAAHNLQHIQTLLRYYLDRHINDHYDLKYKFLCNLMSISDFYKYDDKTWNIFNEILKNMDIYVQSDNNAQNCVEAIIAYSVLRNYEIPDIILNKFSFNTLKIYNNKLNREEGNKIFIFLYNHLIHKIQKLNIINEAEFNEGVKQLENILNLLKDWNRELHDYPSVIDKIKEYISIKKGNAWKVNVSCLYNKKKSWRKLMFEESIVMYPCEDVCVNALKHDPELLTRYRSEVELMCCNDAVSLRRLLSKLRIYWPRSLFEEWTNAYLKRLNNIGGHKALIRGLCTLLSQEQLLDIIKKYAPKEAKIDWNEIDELTLSLQRNIAQNMHIARPQPSPDAILWYAKGDYLKYALPSLLAIFYNLSCNHSQVHIPKLLDAPVSLQKHGIRFAYFKLNHDDLKQAFTNIWKTSKNSSIRAVIFKFTHDLLCNANDATKVQSLWDLLEVFIDNLSFQEDKKIYETLLIVDKVPINVRANYLMKSYKFLQSLVLNSGTEHDYYERKCENLAEYSKEIMEFLCPDFVVGIISDFIDKIFFNSESYIHASGGIISVISAYLLCAKDEATQTERYEAIFVPLMRRSLTMWNETCKGQYFVRKHFQQLLNRLSLDLSEYVLKKNMIIPYKLFAKIQKELENSILVAENYLMLTMWKLTTKFTEIINKNNVTNETTDVALVAPEFGKICLEYLKEDIKLYFRCIYVLFTKALQESLSNLVRENATWEIYEYMLSDNDFVEAYLSITKVLPQYESKEDEVKIAGIRKLILANPSVEVQMHCYNRFKCITTEHSE